MVIDGAKGVEAQTKKLFKVCTLRHIPIFTFVNKCDREIRDPFELVEEIEQVLGIIEENSKRRTQIVPSSIAYGAGLSSAYPIEVTVGGATIFVTDVSRFEKY